MFEPSSSWVIERTTAKSIGDWRQAAHLYRSPAQDWVLRAWKIRTRFAFGIHVTVLKVVTHYQYTSDSGNYSQISREHQYVNALLQSHSPTDIRRAVTNHLDSAINQMEMQLLPQSVTTMQKILRKLLMNWFTSKLYQFTGMDGYEIYCIYINMEKGHIFKDATKLRTGDELPEPPNIAALFAAISATKKAL